MRSFRPCARLSRLSCSSSFLPLPRPFASLLPPSLPRPRSTGNARSLLQRSVDNLPSAAADGSLGGSSNSGNGPLITEEDAGEFAFDVFKVPPGVLPEAPQDSNVPVKVSEAAA